jgi:hypothetical protein
MSIVGQSRRLAALEARTQRETLAPLIAFLAERHGVTEAEIIAEASRIVRLTAGMTERGGGRRIAQGNITKRVRKDGAPAYRVRDDLLTVDGVRRPGQHIPYPARWGRGAARHAWAHGHRGSETEPPASCQDPAARPHPPRVVSRAWR